LLQHLLDGVVMTAQPLQDYLSRLSGRPVAFDEVVSLTSAQQAAVRSWLRNNREFGALARVKSRMSVKMLVEAEEPASDEATSVSTGTAASTPPIERGVAVAGVGLDIEYASTLPEAEDYRTHPFYVENFSTSEIVHCIDRDNPRLSFAGLWAAKEAIAKAQGIDVRTGSLSRIEIRHDVSGRPTSALGSLSICHAGEIAMAMCLASSAFSSEPGAGETLNAASTPSSGEIPPSPPAARAPSRASRGVVFALGLSAIVNVLLVAALFHTHGY
jgi:phosphopantetheine--protein transferase-like protein